MALIKCKDCGKEFSTDAKRCPHCGAKKPSGSSGAKILLLAVFCTLFALITSHLPSIPPADHQQATQSKPAEPKKEAEENRKWHLAVLGAKILRQDMRNPDSFKLETALVMNDGAVCYGYRGQNGFGGVNFAQAVLTRSLKFITSENGGFSSLWNKECADKTGTDYAPLITEALAYMH